MPSMPAWRPAIALLRPTSLPLASTSAPPELPKLMAASVWMKFSNVVTPSWPRPVALTMPWVTVWPSPSGLPIASTGSPTRSRSERPSGMIGSVPRLDLAAPRGRCRGRRRPASRAPRARPCSCTLDLRRALDHVVVGDDVAVHVVDDPGAEAALHALAVVRPDVAEQLGELRRQPGDVRHDDAPLRIDVDDRGRGGVHRVRVAHELRAGAPTARLPGSERSRSMSAVAAAPTATARLPARASAAPRRARPRGRARPRVKSSAASPACPTSARRPPIVHVSPCIMRQSLQRTKIDR